MSQISLHTLPKDLISLITAQCDGTALLKLERVCKIFKENKLCEEAWKDKCLKEYGHTYKEENENWKQAYFFNNPILLNRLNLSIQEMLDARKDYDKADLQSIADAVKCPMPLLDIVLVPKTLKKMNTWIGQWYCGRSVRVFCAKSKKSLEDMRLNYFQFTATGGCAYVNTSLKANELDYGRSNTIIAEFFKGLN
ncbi:MAG: hypothetical protein JHC93_03030 [Parachlamydiales bacterium]|nr:hypothetical protein [Parachlamydiales bacterium]